MQPLNATAGRNRLVETLVYLLRSLHPHLPLTTRCVLFTILGRTLRSARRRLWRGGWREDMGGEPTSIRRGGCKMLIVKSHQLRFGELLELGGAPVAQHARFLLEEDRGPPRLEAAVLQLPQPGDPG